MTTTVKFQGIADTCVAFSSASCGWQTIVRGQRSPRERGAHAASRIPSRAGAVKISRPPAASQGAPSGGARPRMWKRSMEWQEALQGLGPTKSGADPAQCGRSLGSRSGVPTSRPERRRSSRTGVAGWEGRRKRAPSRQGTRVETTTQGPDQPVTPGLTGTPKLPRGGSLPSGVVCSIAASHRPRARPLDGLPNVNRGKRIPRLRGASSAEAAHCMIHLIAGGPHSTGRGRSPIPCRYFVFVSCMLRQPWCSDEYIVLGQICAPTP